MFLQWSDHLKFYISSTPIPSCCLWLGFGLWCGLKRLQRRIFQAVSGGSGGSGAGSRVPVPAYKAQDSFNQIFVHWCHSLVWLSGTNATYLEWRAVLASSRHSQGAVSTSKLAALTPRSLRRNARPSAFWKDRQVLWAASRHDGNSLFSNLLHN